MTSFLPLSPSLSVTVLCGELLREAEFLINQRIHPMTIVQGWRQAVKIARDVRWVILFFLSFIFSSYPPLNHEKSFLNRICRR